jgi:hypothetical protein
MFFLAVLTCAVLLYYIGTSGHDKMNAETMREQVAGAVPTGTGVDDVIKFLDSKRIYHSSLDGGIVRGIVREARKGWFVSTSILLEFHFDSSKKLTRYTVREEYTSL